MGAPSSADALPRLVACNNNIDDDGDGKIDNFDPGCQNGRDDSETNPATPAQCSDTKDNEAPVPPATVPGDGKIDFPNDPGCPFAGNNNENDPAVVPQCADGIDNAPADGATDFPADLDCAWAADNMEVTRLCSDGIDNDLDGKTDWPADFGCAGPNNNSEADPPQCNDGRDNDGDGKIDTEAANPADPGCSSPTDNDETDPPPGAPPAVCADGKDNDADGKIDFPADPGCTSAADTDEADAPPGLPPAQAPASCADGRDNDGDGKIDFPADPGCISAADDDEGPLSVLLPSSTGPQQVLAPFPVVRLRGRISRTSARITLLTVTAPSGSKVSIYCAGRSCPRKRVAVTAGRKAVRVRRFERRLRAGTVLRIYVTKSGFVGKYTRFQIRRGRSPLRTDLCAQTPGATPRRCPAS
jgi:hypothetical protein